MYSSFVNQNHQHSCTHHSCNHQSSIKTISTHRSCIHHSSIKTINIHHSCIHHSSIKTINIHHSCTHQSSIQNIINQKPQQSPHQLQASIIWRGLKTAHCLGDSTDTEQIPKCAQSAAGLPSSTDARIFRACTGFGIGGVGDQDIWILGYWEIILG